jgi:glycerophosphoryl diester phosphodiesterase
MKKTSTIIIAHRGASGLVPSENTVEAFEKAVEVGAAMIEFDVRRTKDKTLVCIHDADIDGARVDGMTFDQLQSRATALGYEVPRLKDVLAAFKGRIAFDVELKERGYEAQVLDVLASEVTPSQFVIKSFHDETVKVLKEMDEQVYAGLLLGVAAPAGLKTRVKEVLPEIRLARVGADFVSPNHQLLRLGFVARMHRLGYKVYVWTVDDVALMKRLVEQGVDAIVTNRPDLGLSVVGAH